MLTLPHNYCRVHLFTMRRFLLSTVFLFFLATIFAQEQDRKVYIQVDGMVYDNEGTAVRYVNIISRVLRSGTETDENGIFSLISTPGDTLLFTTVGYKPGIFILPEGLTYPRYSIDVEMQMDTINIGSVLVLPWKTYGEFVQAVIEYTPPQEQLLINMEANLAIIERQIYSDMKVSPGMGYRYAMAQETERVMTANQTPINNIINPFAWAKFIDGIKNGLLKNKKSEKKKKDRRKKNGESDNKQ